VAAVNILTATGVSKRFGGLLAVDDVDLEIPQGRIRALIGPNGAGKSTLVGLLSGRIPATAGRIFFDGAEITALPAHRRVGMGIAYTFQITSIFGKLSLKENVALAVRRRLKASEKDVEAEVMDSLEKVELAGRADETAGDLSYGHQRLLEIAMGISQKPRLLILDEPTQGLADIEIERFNALIRALAAESTILLIEHNMDVVMETADEITVLDFGRVLAEGTPEEIRADKAVQAAYLGSG